MQTIRLLSERRLNCCFAKILLIYQGNTFINTLKFAKKCVGTTFWDTSLKLRWPFVSMEAPFDLWFSPTYPSRYKYWSYKKVLAQFSTLQKMPSSEKIGRAFLELRRFTGIALHLGTSWLSTSLQRISGHNCCEIDEEEAPSFPTHPGLLSNPPALSI